MKVKFILLIILLSMLFTISSCMLFGRKYGTTFSANENSMAYSKKTPCQVRAVFKMDTTELNKYEWIGTCQSTMPSGGVRRTTNNAMKEIEKCACKHGGDLIKIMGANEQSGVSGSPIRRFNPNSRRVVHYDGIIAKIFRKKT